MYDQMVKLMQKGGTTEKNSGNTVPLGSTKEEVKDDIPAQLSVGEMVIPADVVRYFGVEFFMGLRDKAKMGYKVMDEMGQLGNSEESNLPEDTLFNQGMPIVVKDVEIESEEEEEGGEEEGETTQEEEPVKAAVGAYVDPRYGREPKVPETTGLAQFSSTTSPFGTRPKYYMDPNSQIHVIYDVAGFNKQEDQVQEDWIPINSPAEIRNYAELKRLIPEAPTTDPTTTKEDTSFQDYLDMEDGSGGEGYDMSDVQGVPGSLGAFGDVLGGIGQGITDAISGIAEAFGGGSDTTSGPAGGTAAESGGPGGAGATAGTGVGMGVDATEADEGSGGDGGDKVICTAMVEQYGFGSFRQKLWLHRGLNMNPAYQKGYHAIFLPIIGYVYNKERYNKKHVKFLRRWLENGARRRTIDIWNEKTGKRNLLYRLERNFWESVCFIVGKLK